MAESGDERYYQARMCRIVRKWLVATVACALGKHPNEVLLGFIHREEGIGKTHLTRFLVPEQLKEFYIIAQNNKVFVLEEAFTRNLIVNFDELAGITSRNAEEFKKVMSESKTLVRFYRDPYPVIVPRIGSGTFTSNKTEEMGGWITPSMGMRRFATIELDDINQEYSTSVDIDQLWAEAVMLLDQEVFDYKFLLPDFNEFKEYNKRYMLQTTALRLIDQYYKIPQSEEEGEYMQPQQILHELIQNRQIPAIDKPLINSQKLGEALKQCGFEKRSIRFPGVGTRYAYHVAHI